MTERDLFIAALQITDPAERAAWLDRECGGDGALRERIEVLFKALDQAGSLLENPVVGVAGSPQPAQGGQAGLATAEFAQPTVQECPGTVIGPYKLLQQIGEGGMGTVFMAEQQQPVRRKVALKIIKPGMDSRQVIARFEAERQALALMDHPNIAKVLEAGETASGRPYFVMELVKGQPITKYCDEHHLTPRQRLELFVPVCQAVQHAHQKGIIHRDLKPSNVMVCLYDGKPVPKVIDFGVAKAAGAKLTEHTLFTEFGQVVGTFEYMSPEQAELNQLDIDTRSDIYSLGVLLYELLTGTTPLERKRFKEVAFLEVLRLIREEESPKPSTRLSTTEGLPSIAANRGSEPRKLGGLMRGELDWIAMKALDKDRNRRYETASGFAADVQRYLNDEPVLACPPSATYRFRKFARRNKRALMTGSVLALAVVVAVGSIAGSIGWGMHDRAARQAEVSRQAQDSLVAARTLIADNQPALARQKLAEAKGQIGGDSAALRGLVEEVEALEAELARFEAFFGLIDRAHEAETPGAIELALSGHAPNGIDSSSEYSRRYERDPAKAVPFLVEAMSRIGILEHDDWSSTLDRGVLGPDQVRRIQRAAYEELLWLADDVVRRQEDHRFGQKISSESAARHALVYLQKAEAGYGPTTAFYRIRSQCRKALREEDAARVDEELVRTTPGTIALDHYLLGQEAYDAGNKVEAIKQFEAALRLDPTSYWSLMRLADCQALLGQQRDWAEGARVYTGCIMRRPDHAFAYFSRAFAYHRLERYEDVLADCSKAIDLDPEYALAWSDRGAAYGNLGQWDKSLADSSKAIELDPKLAKAWNNRGAAHNALHQYEKAIADYSKAIEMDPKNATVWSNRSNTYGKLHQYEKALADCSHAIELDPKLANAWANRGVAFEKLGQMDKALADFTKAIDLDPKGARRWDDRGITYNAFHQYQKAIADCSKAIELDPKYASAWNNRGIAYANLGQLEKALADYSKAIELDPKSALPWNNRGIAFESLTELDKALANFSKAIELDPRYANAWANRGTTHNALHQYEKAIADCSKAIELDPKNAVAWNNRGLSYFELRQYEKAIADCSKAMELDPKNWVAWNNRGNVYSDLGQWDKALGDYSKAIELDPKNAVARSNRGKMYNDLHRDQAYEKALADCSKAIELDPKYALAWHNRGVSYYGLRQYEKAIADYSKAIELDPNSALAWSDRGQGFRELGQMDKAIADCSKAIELDPKLAKAWANRGHVYSDLGQWDKALGDYSKAIELDPKLGPAWNNRGRVFHKLGQIDKAVADYSKAIELDPKCAPAWSNRAGAFHKLGQIDKAVADYSKAIELDPELVSAWNNRGNVYDDLGQFMKALADYSKAIELAPKDPMPWDNRGSVFKRLGQMDKALADYSRAIELDPNLASAWNNRGTVFKTQGLLDKALSNFSKAIELDPTVALQWSNRGTTYHHLHQYEKAIADCSKAIELDPKFAKAWRNRGDDYNLLHQYEKAIADYTKAIELDPKNAEGHNNLAMLLAMCLDAKLRDPGRALELAKKAVELAPKEGSFWNTLGITQYCVGDWKAAIEALNKSMDLRQGGDSNDWFFLAMARWQLGEKKDARKWYDQAVEWMEKNDPKNEELGRFRADAEKVLGMKEK